MNWKKIKDSITENQIMYFFVILIAVIAFLLIYGYNILNPTYTDWLLSGGDLSQHYLGWKAYRASDWSFPIGYTDQLAYPYDTSVIFTDSIPIFAVLFKLFRGILPAKFQYFGWWGLLCFVLQGVFSCKILSRYTKNKVQAVLASAFFILAPIMLWRMYVHTALAAQWIILWAIDTILTYRTEMPWKKICIRWAIIGALCSVVHIYMLFLCGMLLSINCLLDFVYQKRIVRSVLMVVTFCLPAAVLIYILGGFSSGMAAESGGLGFFSFNLNSFYNPQGWSSLLPDQEMFGVGQFEGFAYLGLGVMLFIVIAIIVFAASAERKAFLKKQKKKIIVGVIGFIVILVVSVSPIITFGSHYILIKLPSAITDIWSIFRSSGRCSWILVYGIMLVTIYLIVRFSNPKVAITVLVFTLGIQILDLHGMLLEKHNTFSPVVTYETAFSNGEFWEKVGENEEIQHIYIAPSFDAFAQEDGYAIVDWALDYEKTINSFYFARSINDKVKAQLEESLKEPSASEIFIFQKEDKGMYEGYDLNFYEVDGFVVGYSGDLVHNIN